MKPIKPHQNSNNTTVTALGDHFAEWYEQGDRFMLTDLSGCEQVQLSREEAYLLLSLLLAHFQQNIEDQ